MSSAPAPCQASVGQKNIYQCVTRKILCVFLAVGAAVRSGKAELAAGGVPEDAPAIGGGGYLQGEQRAVVDAFRHPQEGPVRGPDAVVRAELVHQRPDVGEQVGVRVGRSGDPDAPRTVPATVTARRTGRRSPERRRSCSGMRDPRATGRPRRSGRRRAGKALQIEHVDVAFHDPHRFHRQCQLRHDIPRFSVGAWALARRRFRVGASRVLRRGRPADLPSRLGGVAAQRDGAKAGSALMDERPALLRVGGCRICRRSKARYWS
jgi:hypothetical protein